MATKTVEIEGIGQIKLYKRRGVRNIRLSVMPTGSVRVTLPYWAPYAAAISFVKSKATWIASEAAKRNLILKNGHKFGSYELIFIAEPYIKTIRSKLKNNQAIVLLPKRLSYNSEPAQKVARQVAIRAMRREAEQTLPDRLELLASNFGFKYGQVRIRQLKSRWGSCSEKGNITLSLFLVQLPQDLIDYVLVHELTHTKYMNHGPKFWEELLRHVPNAKDLRKQIRTVRPALF